MYAESAPTPCTVGTATPQPAMAQTPQPEQPPTAVEALRNQGDNTASQIPNHRQPPPKPTQRSPTTEAHHPLARRLASKRISPAHAAWPPKRSDRRRTGPTKRINCGAARQATEAQQLRADLGGSRSAPVLGRSGWWSRCACLGEVWAVVEVRVSWGGLGGGRGARVLGRSGRRSKCTSPGATWTAFKAHQFRGGLEGHRSASVPERSRKTNEAHQFRARSGRQPKPVSPRQRQPRSRPRHPAQPPARSATRLLVGRSPSPAIHPRHRPRPCPPPPRGVGKLSMQPAHKQPTENLYK